MEEKQMKRAHKVIVVGRKNGTISGVSDVLSFDETEIILETELGQLMICGKGLHISRLSLELGEIDLEGKVESLTYSEKGQRKKKDGSFLGRILQ